MSVEMKGGSRGVMTTVAVGASRGTISPSVGERGLVASRVDTSRSFSPIGMGPSVGSLDGRVGNVNLSSLSVIGGREGGLQLPGFTPLIIESGKVANIGSREMNLGVTAKAISKMPTNEVTPKISVESGKARVDFQSREKPVMSLGGNGRTQSFDSSRSLDMKDFRTIQGQVRDQVAKAQRTPVANAETQAKKALDSMLKDMTKLDVSQLKPVSETPVKSPRLSDFQTIARNTEIPVNKPVDSTSAMTGEISPEVKPSNEVSDTAAQRELQAVRQALAEIKQAETINGEPRVKEINAEKSFGEEVVQKRSAFDVITSWQRRLNNPDVLLERDKRNAQVVDLQQTGETVPEPVYALKRKKKLGVQADIRKPELKKVAPEVAQHVGIISTPKPDEFPFPVVQPAEIGTQPKTQTQPEQKTGVTTQAVAQIQTDQEQKIKPREVVKSQPEVKAQQPLVTTTADKQTNKKEAGKKIIAKKENKKEKLVFKKEVPVNMRRINKLGQAAEQIAKETGIIEGPILVQAFQPGVGEVSSLVKNKAQMNPYRDGSLRELGRAMENGVYLNTEEVRQRAKSFTEMYPAVTIGRDQQDVTAQQVGLVLDDKEKDELVEVTVAANQETAQNQRENQVSNHLLQLHQATRSPVTQSSGIRTIAA